MNLDKILAALPLLPPEELQKLATVVNSLLGQSATPAASQRLFDVYEIACRVIHAKSGRKPPPLSVISGARGWLDRFKLGVHCLETMADTAQPKTKTERAAVTAQLIELCLAAPAPSGETPTPSAMLLAARLPRLEYYIDRQFPGYVASGMLGLLLKRDRDALNYGEENK